MRQELPSAIIRVGLSVAGYHGCALIIGIFLLVHAHMSFGMTSSLPYMLLPQFYAAWIWAVGGWLPALLVPVAVQKRHWWICVVLGAFQLPLALFVDSKWFAGNLLPKTSDPTLLPTLGWAAAYSCASYLLYALGLVLLTRRKATKSTENALGPEHSRSA